MIAESEQGRTEDTLLESGGARGGEDDVPLLTTATITSTGCSGSLDLISSGSEVVLRAVHARAVRLFHRCHLVLLTIYCLVTSTHLKIYQCDP